MSDFSINVDILRGQMVEALIYAHAEQVAWVLIEFTDRYPNDSLEELVDCIVAETGDTTSVAEFFRGLAGAIDKAGGEQ